MSRLLPQGLALWNLSAPPRLMHFAEGSERVGVAPMEKLGKPDQGGPQLLATSKIAETVARNLEERIIAQGWPVGHPIGREADLAASAGVGRWAMREALSLLEEGGLIESRRGNGGGMFVAALPATMVITRLSNYIDFMGAPAAELSILLEASDKVMIDRAASRMTGAGRQELAEILGRVETPVTPETIRSIAPVHPVLLRMAGNPALKLTSASVTMATMQACWYSTLDDEAYRATFIPVAVGVRDMAAALVDGAVDKAHAASAMFVSACEKLFQASANSLRLPGHTQAAVRAYELYPAGRPMKKSESVARHLREMILDAGWPVGAQLGTLPELMERFDVGRSVLREALRGLERMGAIRVERGIGGGVKVTSPNPADIISACRRHLKREHLRPEEAKEVLDAIAHVQRRRTSAQGSDPQPLSLLPLIRQILAAPDH